MRRKSTRRAAALALGLLGGALAALAGGGRPAAAATLIQSCPFTAMTPGPYVLVGDLTCPSPAITVTANDVNLVLGGRTLTALNPASFGVRAQNVTALRISSGTITGFGNGISLLNTPGASIAAVTVTGTSPRNGIDAQFCNVCQFAGSRTTNGFGSGISVSGTGAKLLGNTATGNVNDAGITLSSPLTKSRFSGGRLARS